MTTVKSQRKTKLRFHLKLQSKLKSKLQSKSQSKLTSKLQAGFTLLEVMVALAILAVVAVAASQASRSYTQSVGSMKTRTQAYFVAQNAIADLRIQPIANGLTGENTRQVEENGQTWQVTITPQPLEQSPSDNLKKISVAVAPVSDGRALHNIVTLDTILAKPTGDGL